MIINPQTLINLGKLKAIESLSNHDLSGCVDRLIK
ncbi:hypothetical protein IIDPJIOB_00013 [Aeromonas veronii]